MTDAEKERAAVVAWLRKVATDHELAAMRGISRMMRWSHNEKAAKYRIISGRIERGDHIKGMNDE